MKVNKTIIILACITWAAFVTFTFLSFEATIPKLLAIAGAMILFTILLAYVVHRYHLTKLSKLNQGIISLTTKEELHNRLNAVDDPLADAIVDSINKLLDSIQTKQKQLNRTIETKDSELKKAKVKFQESLDRLAATQPKSVKENTNTKTVKSSNLLDQNQFVDTLNKAISHVKRRKKILAVLVIEIDEFESISKQIGANYSQLFLNETAIKFKSLLRSEDTIAMIENNRFAILLNDIVKPKFAAAVAEKIIQSSQSSVQFEQEAITTTYRIAISVFPHDGSSAEDILLASIKVLSDSGAAKKATYQFNHAELHREAIEYIQLEKALRQAIDKNELSLYYQPKLDLKRGIIVAAEALIRWTHPQLGIINAGKLIPIAEECGLIMPIGEWTLREACKHNKYWQDEGYTHLFVSVNISPKQFQHPDMVNSIHKILQETGLKPAYLELEINENTVMDDMEFATRRLAEIKAIGVKISIDHFGSGQTSISHLKSLPISTIKIDRSFIDGIPNNPNDMAIVNAFISLSHHLGLEVVAEGVETADQAQFLGEQNCDLIQGYYVSHPQPADKIIQQFKKLSDEINL